MTLYVIWDLAADRPHQGYSYKYTHVRAYTTPESAKRALAQFAPGTAEIRPYVHSGESR